MTTPSCVELNTGTIRADPMFVNSSILDLRLQSTSPAINFGLTIPIVDSDYDGITSSIRFSLRHWRLRVLIWDQN